jgi:predicted DNA-binding protein
MAKAISYRFDEETKKMLEIISKYDNRSLTQEMQSLIKKRFQEIEELENNKNKK